MKTMNTGTHNECNTLEKMLDYLRGKGAPSEREQIVAHLAAGCPTCLEDQSWLTEVLQLVASDHSFDFSPAVLARTVALFKTELRKQRPTLRQFLAQLVFDSLLQSQLAAVRSGAPALAQSRQLLFRAEPYDIDLRFEVGEDGRTEELIGQILRTDADPQSLSNLPVQLWQTDLLQAEVQTNARGIFKFNQVIPGRYQLRLLLTDGEICLDSLETTQSA